MSVVEFVKFRYRVGIGMWLLFMIIVISDVIFGLFVLIGVVVVN